MLLDNSVEITPWAFAESMYTLNGEPFRFGPGRNYLKPIHNADIDQMIMMTGRQVEKSTTASVKIANNILLRKFIRNLYVAPLNEQVKVFSKGRVDKLFRYSQNDIVRRRYKSRELSDQVFHKEFANGSEIYFRNCFEEGDNIRGLSVDDIFLDEIQDINVDAIPVILETQTRSKSPRVIYTGTPKTFSNTIQVYWDMSSQAEWVIRCHRCGTHQVLGITNVEPTQYVCRKCKGEIPDIVRAMGRWEHRYPERKLKGFHITQMMVPDMAPEKVYDKIENYPDDKLYNEVLGKSYEKADKPFSQLLMNRITRDDLEVYPNARGIFANRPLFMGIDWGEGEKSGKAGTGYTVITIFGFNAEGKFQMLYAKRFERGKDLDPDYQLQFIEKMMNQYRIQFCIADYGGGAKENQRLAKKFPLRFAQCQYVGQQKKKIVYEGATFTYKIPRSPWLTDFVEFVNADNMLIPGMESLVTRTPNQDIEWIHKNFTAVYSEYRKSYSGRSEELFYGHSPTEPDDAVHASLYAWLASMVYRTHIGIPGVGGGNLFAGTNGE